MPAPARRSSLVDRSRPSGRFGAADRLRKRSDFDHAFSQGRRLRNRGLSIVVAPAATGRSRLGLAISRGAGNAPRRARIRRLCREAFRALRHGWPQPVDLVVLVRAPWPVHSLADVRDELATLMGRVRWTAI